MQLISLQKARGFWELNDALAEVCCKSMDELRRTCPNSARDINAEYYEEIWATALSLVLLVGKFGTKKDEWERIAKKGMKWMKSAIPSEKDLQSIVFAAAKELEISTEFSEEIIHM